MSWIRWILKKRSEVTLLEEHIVSDTQTTTQTHNNRQLVFGEFLERFVSMFQDVTCKKKKKISTRRAFRTRGARSVCVSGLFLLAHLGSFIAPPRSDRVLGVRSLQEPCHLHFFLE